MLISPTAHKAAHKPSKLHYRVVQVDVRKTQKSLNMLPSRTVHVRTIKNQGDRLLRVTRTRSGVTVDGAKVVTADIAADNGVIHVIDKVMMPTS